MSPSTARLDRIEKKQVYERNAVREYVRADFKNRKLQCILLGGGRFDEGRRVGTDEIFTSSAVPGFTVSVRELFPDP